MPGAQESSIPVPPLLPRRADLRREAVIAAAIGREGDTEPAHRLGLLQDERPHMRDVEIGAAPRLLARRRAVEVLFRMQHEIGAVLRQGAPEIGEGRLEEAVAADRAGQDRPGRGAAGLFREDLAHAAVFLQQRRVVLIDRDRVRIAVDIDDQVNRRRHGQQTFRCGSLGDRPDETPPRRRAS